MSWAVKVQKCSSDWKTQSDVSLAFGGRGLPVMGGAECRIPEPGWVEWLRQSYLSLCCSCAGEDEIGRLIAGEVWFPPVTRSGYVYSTRATKPRVSSCPRPASFCRSFTAYIITSFLCCSLLTRRLGSTDKTVLKMFASQRHTLRGGGDGHSNLPFPNVHVLTFLDNFTDLKPWPDSWSLKTMSYSWEKWKLLGFR